MAGKASVRAIPQRTSIGLTKNRAVVAPRMAAGARLSLPLALSMLLTSCVGESSREFDRAGTIATEKRGEPSYIPEKSHTGTPATVVRTMGTLSGKIRSNWVRASFRGNPYLTVTAIDTSGGIVLSRTSGTTPCFVQASAKNITATGSDRPYEDLEFRWDFGDPSGAETFTSPANAQPVNANADQFGPEAACCYRAAGTYTVTLTIRGKNGSGYTTATVTTGVTVTAFNPSSADYWLDETNGLDTNDGLDPWGFAVTGGSYTSSTKRLVKAGAFTAYDHAAATAPALAHDRLNFVRLTGGTGITPGLYEIAAKIGNDEIELVTSAGSNSSNVTTSSGPKKTPATLNGSNRRIRLRRGGNYPLTTQLIRVTNNVRWTSYGSGNRPRIYASSAISDYFFKWNQASGVQSVSNYVWSYLDFDCDNSNGVLYTSSSGGTGVGNDLYLDNCLVRNKQDTTSAFPPIYFSGGVSGVTTANFGAWACDVDMASESVRQSFFDSAQNWTFAVGCSFTGGVGTSSVLDHHIYTGSGNHQLYRWIDFGPSTTRNYCINGNCTSTVGGHTDYFVVSECDMSGVERGLDLSNANNDRVSGGAFRNTVVEGNSFHGLSGDGVVLYYNADTVTFRDNVFWGNSGLSSRTTIEVADPFSAATIYLNKFHHQSTGGVIEFPASTSVAYDVRDNEIVCTSATAGMQSGPAAPAGTIAGNRYYAPNDTSPEWSLNSVSKTFSQWQAAGLDTDGAISNPGWTDSVNGDFTVPVPAGVLAGGTSAVTSSEKRVPSGGALAAGMAIRGVGQAAFEPSGGAKASGMARDTTGPRGYVHPPIVSFCVNLFPIQNVETIGPKTNARSIAVPILQDPNLQADQKRFFVPGFGIVEHGDEFHLQGEVAARTVRNHTNGIEGDFTSTPLVLVKRY